MARGLTLASAQWASRPDDERCDSIADFAARARGYFDSAREARVRTERIEIIPDGEELLLHGKDTGTNAQFTNYSFGQLAQRVRAPAQFLATLTPETASTVLNERLQATERDSWNLLLRENGDLTVRAFLTEKYSRLWNVVVAGWLERATERGWQVPPARPARPGQRGTRVATEADCLPNSQWRSSLAIKPGDLIAPAGLYMSDRDCFAFLVRERTPFEVGGQAMNEGFIFENSEEGDRRYRILRFVYRFICGNHIIWSADNIVEYSLPHIGADMEFRAAEMTKHVLQLPDSRHKLESELRATTASLVAKKQDKVAPALVAKLGLTKAQADDAATFALVNEDQYGDPRSRWAVAGALAELSQREPFCERRVALDRAAGRCLQIDF